MRKRRKEQAGKHTATVINQQRLKLSLIHISEPTRQAEISYAVFCLKKKKKTRKKKKKIKNIKKYE